MTDLWENFIKNLIYGHQNMQILLRVKDYRQFFSDVFDGLTHFSLIEEKINIDTGRMYQNIGFFYKYYSDSKEKDEKRFFLEQATRYYNLFLVYTLDYIEPQEITQIFEEIYCQYRSTYNPEVTVCFCPFSSRKKLEDIRKGLKQKLENLEEEEGIQTIRSDYNKEIKNFHNEIIRAASACYDRSRNGDYPHHFELLSLGSIAQNYATAYSDLEIAVLLDKKFANGYTCDNKYKRQSEIEQFIGFLKFHYTIIGEEVESHPDGFRITGTTLDAGSLEKILYSKSHDMLFVNFSEDLADYWINLIFEKENEGCRVHQDELVILGASPLFSTKEDSLLYTCHQERKDVIWKKNIKDSVNLKYYLSKWTQKFFEYMNKRKTEMENLQNPKLIDFKAFIFQPIILWVMYVSFLLGYTHFSIENPPTIDHIIALIDSKKIFSSTFLDKLRIIIEKTWFLKCFWELTNEFKVVKQGRNEEVVGFSISLETIENSKNKKNLEGKITKDIFEIQENFILLLINSGEAIKNFFTEQRLPEEESLQQIFHSKLIEAQKILKDCGLDENEFSKKIINQMINVNKLLTFFPKKNQQELVDSVPPIFITTYSEIENSNFLEKYSCGSEYYKNLVNLKNINVEDEEPQWEKDWFLVKKNNEEEILWGLLDLEKIFRYLSVKSSADTIEPYFGLTETYENKILCLFFIGSQTDFAKFCKIENRDSRDVFVKKIRFYEKLFSIKLIHSNQKNIYKESFIKVFEELKDFSSPDETKNRRASEYLGKFISSMSSFIPTERETAEPLSSSTRKSTIEKISRSLSKSVSSINSDPSTPRSSSSQEEKETFTPSEKDIVSYNFLNNEQKEILKSKNKEERYEYIISESTYSGWTLFHFLLKNSCSRYVDILSLFSFFNKDDVLKILCKKTIYGYTPLHYLMLTEYPNAENKKLLRLILYYFDEKSLHELSDQFSIFSHTPMHFFLLNSDERWNDDDFELIVSFIEEENLHNFFWQKEKCLLPILCLVLERCDDFNLILYILKKIKVDINEIIKINNDDIPISDFIEKNVKLDGEKKQLLRQFWSDDRQEPLGSYESELQEKKTELNNKKVNFNRKDKLEISFLILQEKIKNELPESELKEDVKKMLTDLFTNIQDKLKFINKFHPIFILLIQNYSEDIVLDFLNILPVNEYKCLLIILKGKESKDALYFSAEKKNNLFTSFMDILLQEQSLEKNEHCISIAMSFFLTNQKNNEIKNLFNFIKNITKEDDKSKIKIMIEKVTSELSNEERKYFIIENLNSVSIDDTMKTIKNKKNDLEKKLGNQADFKNKLKNLKEEILKLNEKIPINQEIFNILEEKISKIQNSIQETKNGIQQYGESSFSHLTLFPQTDSEEKYNTLQPINNF